ncbi:MAG: type II toxin-antitoxin system RelE/ParE family toxin [Patescibacteria group bacterium]
MNKTIVVYYTSLKGDSPVSDFLDSLNYKQQTKLLRIIKYVEIYGLQSILPHTKKLSGTLLWEMRILGRDSIRALYAVVYNNSILILNGFIKKSQKTPPNEISIAMARLKEWKHRNS